MEENIREIAATVREFLINLITRIDDISKGYGSEGILDRDRIVNLLEDLDSLAEGIHVIGPAHETIDLFEFREKLDQMTDALERSDHSVFVDTISYELKPLLEFWSEEITKRQRM